MTPLLFFPARFVHIPLYGLHTACHVSPVFNLKTSSSLIGVQLSPAQLLKVGPRRKCRVKTARAICWVWLWPVSDNAGQVLVLQIFCSPSCCVFMCGLRSLCFHSWASCLDVRGAEADLVSRNGLVFQCGCWWRLGKLHWNVNTSKNNHYPKAISLSLHIWQPQSFAF